MGVLLCFYLITLYPAHCALASHPLTILPLHPREWGPPGYPSTLTLQVSVRLGESSPSEASEAAQLEEHMPPSGNSFRDSPAPVVRDPHADQAARL